MKKDESVFRKKLSTTIDPIGLKERIIVKFIDFIEENKDRREGIRQNNEIIEMTRKK